MPKPKANKSNTLAGIDLAQLPIKCGETAEAEMQGEADLQAARDAYDLDITPTVGPRDQRKISAVRRPTSLPTFQAQPIETQQQTLKREWSNLAYVLVERANIYARTITKKDFGRLMQLVTTAGIAVDKVLPKHSATAQGNLIVNMFGSLDTKRLAGVLGQTGPTIDAVSSPCPSMDTDTIVEPEPIVCVDK
jgi:hypothetical protein